MSNLINKRITPEGSEGFIDELHRNKVLFNSTTFLIRMALAHGAFLAGGFVRKYVHHKLRNLWALHNPVKKHHERDWEYELQNYLHANSNVRQEIPKNSTEKFPIYWAAGSGDIDVFFPSEDHIREFLKALSSNITWHEILSDKLVVTKDSPMGFAKEFVMFAKNSNANPYGEQNGCQRVQIVTKFCGTQEEIISSFDKDDI